MVKMATKRPNMVDLCRSSCEGIDPKGFDRDVAFGCITSCMVVFVILADDMLGSGGGFPDLKERRRNFGCLFVKRAG